VTWSHEGIRESHDKKEPWLWKLQNKRHENINTNQNLIHNKSKMNLKYEQDREMTQAKFEPLSQWTHTVYYTYRTTDLTLTKDNLSNSRIYCIIYYYTICSVMLTQKCWNTILRIWVKLTLSLIKHNSDRWSFPKHTVASYCPIKCATLPLPQNANKNTLHMVNHIKIFIKYAKE